MIRGSKTQLEETLFAWCYNNQQVAVDNTPLPDCDISRFGAVARVHPCVQSQSCNQQGKSQQVFPKLKRGMSHTPSARLGTFVIVMIGPLHAACEQADLRTITREKAGSSCLLPSGKCMVSRTRPTANENSSYASAPIKTYRPALERLAGFNLRLTAAPNHQPPSARLRICAQLAQ